MPNIDIVIHGRSYAVACDPGQETRVRDLAAMLDSRVQLLADPNPTSAIPEPHLLVLAGLMLADELIEANAQRGAPAPPLAEDEELLVAAVNHLTERIEGIAARLEQN